MSKKCFYCGSHATIHYGVKRQKQKHLCKSCGKQFVNRKAIDYQRLWNEYVYGKQTIKQLSARYGISHDTITRHFDTIRPPRMVSSPKQVVILIDTTYWGWTFWVVVIKDVRTSKVLWCKFTRKKETLTDYQEGIAWLEEYHFEIQGIVCDGFRGMFQMLNIRSIKSESSIRVLILRKLGVPPSMRQVTGWSSAKDIVRGMEFS